MEITAWVLGRAKEKHSREEAWAERTPKDIWQNNFCVRGSHYLTWNNRLHVKPSKTVIRNKNVPKMAQLRMMIMAKWHEDRCFLLSRVRRQLYYSAFFWPIFVLPMCPILGWCVLSFCCLGHKLLHSSCFCWCCSREFLPNNLLASKSVSQSLSLELNPRQC